MRENEVDALIDRVLAGDAGVGERERLEQWRQASPENQRHYAQTARLLQAARTLDGDREGSARPTAADVLRPAAAPAPEEAGPRRGPGLPGTGDPQTGTGTRTRTERRSRKQWLPWGVAAAAVLALVMTRLASSPVADPGPVIRTGPAELATVELPDGSVVRLGPSSRLDLAVPGTDRGVALTGRAFFDIAEQAASQFRVRTAVGEVVVLGTEFELDARDDRLDLLVVEGRVALSAGGRSVAVAGGERSRIAEGVVLAPEPVSNPDSALAWAGTFLVFRSTPLGEAAARVEQAYGVRVDVAEAIAGRTVTGLFVDRTPREVLGVLCSIGDARCRFLPDRTVITARSRTPDP